jgi:D-3-phosphoglycerate dehydrogenase
VTPHLGASTEEAQTNVAIDVAQEVLAVLEGSPVRYAVNLPRVSQETMKVIGPYIPVAQLCGNVAVQLAEGQFNEVHITYEGGVAEAETSALKAAVIGGLLSDVSEERITVVNAAMIAQSRGLSIVEEQRTTRGNYANLVTVEVRTSSGKTSVSGLVRGGKPHIVQVNGYTMDIDATAAPYALFCENMDKPGRIGAVGTILGNADINIAFMQVGRDAPRGRALMVLGLDEEISEQTAESIRSTGDIYSVKQVKL